MAIDREENDRWAQLSYGDFRKMATDSRLSPHEKIGFPDSYRLGFEKEIHADILHKLPNLNIPGCRFLDIGPGCAGLPKIMLKHCEKQNHNVVFVDSEEMLSHYSDNIGLVKVTGFYPDCYEKLLELGGNFDVILCYSVFHYIFVEASFWRFIDVSLELLAPGGQMLIGDIPNVGKRKRFFSSEGGIKFHKEFMQSTENPKVNHYEVEFDKIDDSVLMGVIMRIRNQGCDAYWLPQPSNLPMANRREDLLIIKP